MKTLAALLSLPVVLTLACGKGAPKVDSAVAAEIIQAMKAAVDTPRTGTVQDPPSTSTSVDAVTSGMVARLRETGAIAREADHEEASLLAALAVWTTLRSKDPSLGSRALCRGAQAFAMGEMRRIWNAEDSARVGEGKYGDAQAINYQPQVLNTQQSPYEFSFEATATTFTATARGTAAGVDGDTWTVNEKQAIANTVDACANAKDPAGIATRIAQLESSLASVRERKQKR